MPSAAAPNPRAGSAPPDNLDNLFNYDDDVEDFLRDLPLDKDNSNNSAPQEPAKNIDEEIVVKKKRKPGPKLDENRLLSQDGIPRLRRITKSRLKFRGKGHEFTDISGLLNTYQLWLDDLYPRAKFRDALTMVEKVGHSKRMQVTRKAWLDATKPYQRDASPDRVGDAEMSGALPDDGEAGGRPTTQTQHSDDDLFEDAERPKESEGVPREEPSGDAPEEDELDALMAGYSPDPPRQPITSQQKSRGPFEEDDSDEDELDALLDQPPPTDPGAKSAGPDGHEGRAGGGTAMADDFADEEEVMASMAW